MQWTKTWNTLLLFEDDFVLHRFVDKSMIQAAIKKTMVVIPDWDVIALSLNIGSETVLEKLTVPFSSTFVARVSLIRNAHTTGGYIARHTIIYTLSI